MTSANQNAIVSDDSTADRDIPKLSSTKKKNNLSRMVIAGVMIVAVVVVAGGVVMFLDRLEESKKAKALEQAKAKPAPEPVQKSRDFEAAKKRIAMEEAANMPPPAAAATAIPMDKATDPTGASMQPPAGATSAGGAAQPGGPANAANGTPAAGSGVPAAPAAPVRTLTQRRMESDLLVSGGTGGASGVTVANHSAPAAGFLGSTGQANQSARGGLDDKLKPSQLLGGLAAQRPDLNFLLRRGTAIPCVQKTRIVTTNPGPVGCVVAKDVYSANGKVLLIERGSESFGELRDPLVAGQTFIPVLWSRIETPLGVVVDINSFGTDSLGASGQPILVDNHIMQRFGGAVMLSLISDIGQALTNKASEGQGTIQLTTSSKAGQDLASRTLESTINIPPTGYGQPGDVINIFVVRDIDFRSVYELARH